MLVVKFKCGIISNSARPLKTATNPTAIPKNPMIKL